ncbi:MAG: hypothetical protein R3D26_22790 [Cyanobacteriota/Melainabacteria group bacterium]
MANQKYGSSGHRSHLRSQRHAASSVVNENGKPTILDPSYGAGKEIILPSAQDIPRLTEQYRAEPSSGENNTPLAPVNPTKPPKYAWMYGDTPPDLAEKIWSCCTYRSTIRS